MNKMKKRFIALLVIFTSIISFLPAGLKGQAANAATTTSDATTIHVYNGNGNTPTEITATTNSAGNQHYDCAYTANRSGKFDIAVNNEEVTDLASQATIAANKLTAGSSGSVSGITDQDVEITSVNGISVSATNDDGTNTLNSLGIYITGSSYPTIIGQRITGMPLGVNKVEYNVKATTTTYNYSKETVTNSDGTTTTTVDDGTSNPVTKTTEYDDQGVTIYFGSSYVSSAVNPMTIKAYVGDSTQFDSDDNISGTYAENNEAPFLYTTKKVSPDSDMSLKYTFDVPFSLTKLKYSMTLDSAYSDATIYRNGELMEDVDIDTGTNSTVISGNLSDLRAGDDLILIRLGTSSSTISRLMCVELNYDTIDTNEDYSMYDAGLTKGEYASDDSVQAYIGKVFTVEDEGTYNQYTGNIYISKKADTISVDPTLIVDKDKASSDRTLAYEVSNHYIDSTTKSNKVIGSTLKNGKQYVDFDAGGDDSSSTNVLYVNVYPGENGTKTAGSSIVARYILNVTVLDADEDAFSMDLAFDDDDSTDSTYLTQPGVSKDDDGEIDFSSSRRTYDLYYKESTTDTDVKVTFTGIQSSNNEYLKFWTASTIDSTSYDTATYSTSGDDYTVDLSGARKMKVQAYCDSTTGAAVKVGDDYVFYLPENYDDSDTSTGNTSSDNALLNSLKVKGATLEDGDGNEGFTSTTYDYTTTVGKSDTTAQITAIVQDDNVKSIVATIDGSDTTYDLVSGTASKLPLDSDGSTTVNIVVTAQDGTTTKTYTIIIKNSSEGSDATLSNVILNTGDYDFDSSEDTTKVHVSQNTTSIKVTPVPSDTSATVTVDGKEYSSSAITVSLKGSQKTEITIVVTSEDGSTSKTYTLEVYRTDSDSWNDDSDDSDDSSEDDQYYDDYYDCWVDTTKYEEWGKIGSKPAYFDKNNRQVKDAWISTGGKYYYLNSSGYRASGWKVDDDNGKTYYLDPTTGEMKNGWINLNNNWYYLGLNGVMQKGWLYLNKKWYYFTPNGQMVVNQSMYIDGEICNFGQDGAKY